MITAQIEDITTIMDDKVPLLFIIMAGSDKLVLQMKVISQEVRVDSD